MKYALQNINLCSIIYAACEGANFHDFASDESGNHWTDLYKRAGGDVNNLHRARKWY